MKLKQKILLISIIPLLLSTGIIGYNIVQLKSLKSSTEEIVKMLVQVEELNSSSKSLQKSLNAYSLNISEGNRNDIEMDLEKTKLIYDTLALELQEIDQLKLAEKISSNFAIAKRKKVFIRTCCQQSSINTHSWFKKVSPHIWK